MAMDEEFDGNNKEIDGSKWTVWWELIKSFIGLDEDMLVIYDELDGNEWRVWWELMKSLMGIN